MPGPGLLQRLLQDRELGLPSHEPGEPPPYRGLQTLPDGTRPHELEDLDRVRQAPDRDRPQGPHHH